jgi:alpha-1,3-rhamnosyl/mannosyltransferase
MRAGVSLSVHQIIDHLLRLEGPERYSIFVDGSFEVPESWRASSRVAIVRPPRILSKRRVPWELLLAGAMTFVRKTDVWLSTSSTGVLYSRGRRVVLVHDLFPITHPQYYTARAARMDSIGARLSLPRASHVLTNSDFSRRELIRVLGIPSERISILPFDISHASLPKRADEIDPPSLARLGVPFRRYFFALNTIEPRKNMPVLLEAIASLAPELRARSCGLVVAGATGRKTSDVFADVARWRIEDLVAFLGYVPDEALPLLFGGCEAFVCASWIEGFGLPVLEAHHFGAPVICSTGGALPEVAGPGALMFEPDRPAELSAHLRKFLLEGADRDHLVQAGRRHAEGFSWEAAARITLEVLRGAPTPLDGAKSRFSVEKNGDES